LVSVAPTKELVLIALFFVGMASITVIARTAATLQFYAEPAKRGRVMSLWTITLIGTTPVGALISGKVSQVASPRWALAMGGAASVVAAAYGAFELRRRATHAVLADTPSLTSVGT
jgi:MFS family permease